VILNTAAFPSPRIPARIALCKLRGAGHRDRARAQRLRVARDLDVDAPAAPECGRKAGVPAAVRFLGEPRGGERLCAGHSDERGPSDVGGAGGDRGRGCSSSRTGALVVWGGKDFCFNDHFYAEWRERLPQAESVYLPDAGHYVLADANTEVVPRIARFLTGAA
jgi:pimeloyl-ACP methyl ester carboxylesterase